MTTEILLEDRYHQLLKKAKKIIKTIAVSSAEAERAFSLMNSICTPQRNKLNISNISQLMAIKALGLPLKYWDPTKYVKSWLRKGNHSACDLRVKRKRNEEPASENEKGIWSLLAA